MERKRSDRRAEVLALLRAEQTPMSIAEVARRLRVHLNTARLHLDALTETGQLERADAPPSRPGRPAQLFRAPRRMDPDGPRNYQLLAEALMSGLAEGPDPVGRARKAGREWGLRAGPPPHPGMDTAAWLIEVLADAGFAPTPRPRDRIDLRNCPFLEIVEPHDRLVCALHLGYLQGAAERAGGAVRVRRLEPFAEPDVCRVVLAEG